MSNSNKIFNVDEVKGKEHSALETTAAEAQVEAPTAKIAREIEMNAKQEQTVAEQAAAVAESMGKKITGEPMSATDKLQRDVSETTNAAISEGKKDVDHVKDVGAGYVEQVKELARSAVETAQTYLPESIAPKQEQTAAEQAAAVAESMGKKFRSEPMTATDKLQRDVSETTKAAISEGKKDADHVKDVGAGYVEQVKELARSAIETAQTYLPESIAPKQEQTAAGQAAAVAESMGKKIKSEPMAATDKLQRDVSETTNAAISEGKKDVDHVRDVGAGYVGQVKELSQSAIETAQTYLPESIAHQLPNISEGAKNAESQPSSTATRIGK